MSVLSRLLEMDPFPEHGHRLAWVSWPRELFERVVVHPDPVARAKVLENRNLPADLFAGMAFDSDPEVRLICAVNAGEFGVPMPAEAIAALCAAPEASTRYWAVMHRDTPDEVRMRLVEDPEAKVRYAALHERIWGRLRPEVREALRRDPDAHIQEWISDFEATEERGSDSAGAEEDPEKSRWELAEEPELADELARSLIRDEDVEVRRAVARNPALSTELALSMAADPDNGVRLAVSTREDLTEEQRALIDYTIPEGRQRGLGWIRSRLDDPDVVRRAATSGHVLLRRNAAEAAHLPPDLLARLAADPDYFVRLTLCRANDDAPSELLVDMYASGGWGYLVLRPNFPTVGMARYADDPNPRLRTVSLRDPEIAPDVIARLTRDPVEWVRESAITDPRLPLDRLLELLDDPGTAAVAARNPGLGEERMHAMLDAILEA
ncbi:hypothetical protein [Embleya sp. MST-111070]|uniref:hypothetical protein n=1 Tax=Embleya sp. MST-111070 TaxID=3398231 RepID=UPI003F73DF05